MAVVTLPYKTRKDGVNLFLTLDAVVNEKGEPINGNGKPIKEIEKDGNPIPRGFYILQNETQIEYAEAIDVEDAPYTYSETDKPIEESEGVSDE